jgi:hypothetical protein
MVSAIGPYTDQEKRIGKLIFDTMMDQQDNHLKKDGWDSQLGKGWHGYYCIAARAVIEAMNNERKTDA